MKRWQRVSLGNWFILVLLISSVATTSQTQGEAEVEKENDIVEGVVDDVDEQGDECSRISPKEIFYTDLLPRLLKAFDEMSHLIDGVIDGLEEAMVTLEPHVSISPLGDLRAEDVFPEMRSFLHGTLREVYDQVTSAWRDLISAYINAHPSPNDILHHLHHIQDVQEKGDVFLAGALQELSIMTKTVITNSIYVVQRSLHLPDLTPEHQVAESIHKQLDKVAPNFMGRVMAGVLERGSDPSTYKKLLPNPLRELTSAVTQMCESLDVAVHDGEVDLDGFWMEAVARAHQHMQDSPVLEEDLHIIYQNKVYLTELTLSLMATW